MVDMSHVMDHAHTMIDGAVQIEDEAGHTQHRRGTDVHRQTEADRTNDGVMTGTVTGETRTETDARMY